MKEIQTILPYYVYKNLAESKQGFPGDKDFIELLIPALKEITDDEVKIWIGCVQNIQISQAIPFYNAIKISFIREYVVRVEKEKEVERKKAELYAKFEAECMTEPWYKQYSKYSNIQNTLNAKVQWGLALYFNDIALANDWEKAFNQALATLEAQEIREKIRTEKWFTGIDPATIATEDKYSKYSVADFQVEVNDLCKRSLDAQMHGDKKQAQLLTSLANELTARQMNLQNKIAQLKGGNYNQKSDLLDGSYSNSKQNNVGDITLKSIQDAMNHWSWKMKGKKPYG